MANKLLKISNNQHAIVPSELYEKLACYTWGRRKDGYIARNSRLNGKQKTVYLHKVVLTEPGLETDHINGNKLDCSYNNLRACTHAQNTANKLPRSSGTKGISWVESRKRWSANIRVNDKLLFLGRFKEKLDAMVAYNNAAVRHFGEYAHLNKIKG